MQNFTSEELEISELPEREEMLLGLSKVVQLALSGVDATVLGIGASLGNLFPIKVGVGV